MSAEKYVGAVDVIDWCARHAILNSTHRCTGNQWSWRKTGVMWSRHSLLVSRRAAAFCTDCTFLSGFAGTTYSRELHQSRRHAIKVRTMVLAASNISDLIAGHTWVTAKNHPNKEQLCGQTATAGCLIWRQGYAPTGVPWLQKTELEGRWCPLVAVDALYPATWSPS